MLDWWGSKRKGNFSIRYTMERKGKFPSVFQQKNGCCWRSFAPRPQLTKIHCCNESWMLWSLQLMGQGQQRKSCLVRMNTFVFMIHTSQLFLIRARYLPTMPQMSSNLPIRTSLAHTVAFKPSSYERLCLKKKHPIPFKIQEQLP